MPGAGAVSRLRARQCIKLSCKNEVIAVVRESNGGAKTQPVASHYCNQQHCILQQWKPICQVEWFVTPWNTSTWTMGSCKVFLFWPWVTIFSFPWWLLKWELSGCGLAIFLPAYRLSWLLDLVNGLDHPISPFLKMFRIHTQTHQNSHLPGKEMNVLRESPYSTACWLHQMVGALAIVCEHWMRTMTDWARKSPTQGGWEHIYNRIHFNGYSASPFFYIISGKY